MTVQVIQRRVNLIDWKVFLLVLNNTGILYTPYTWYCCWFENLNVSPNMVAK